MVADSDLHMLKEIKFRLEPKSNGIGAFKGEMSIWDRIGLWVMRKFFIPRQSFSFFSSIY